MYNPFRALLYSAFWYEEDLTGRVKAVKAVAPADFLTGLARILTKAFTYILVILLPLSKLTSAVAGFLIVLTIGVLSFFFRHQLERHKTAVTGFLPVAFGIDIAEKSRRDF